MDSTDTPDGPVRAPEQMEADLRELIATVQNRHLLRLLALVFGERTAIWKLFRVAPAAKHYHQAYAHGLLEHSLTVAQAVGAISATFPGIDRDIAVTGALLHDIGKLEAYEVTDGAIAMSDGGRLYGEIPLGYYRVRRLIENLSGFPPELERALLHIILSHHGALEHGSPVVPCTREATLVHMIDNLGGRLGSFDRVERALLDGRAVVGVRQGHRGRRVLRRPRGAWSRRRTYGRLSAAFAPNLRKLRGVSVTSGERHAAPNYPSVRGEGHRETDPPAVADLIPDGGAPAGHRT